MKVALRYCIWPAATLGSAALLVVSDLGTAFALRAGAFASATIGIGAFVAWTAAGPPFRRLILGVASVDTALILLKAEWLTLRIARTGELPLPVFMLAYYVGFFVALYAVLALLGGAFAIAADHIAQRRRSPAWRGHA